jgi:hypothetical protein
LVASGPCLVRQPEAGQRDAGKADAEFLQRLSPGDRLRHAFCELIEFVVHTFPFVWFVMLCGNLPWSYRADQVA